MHKIALASFKPPRYTLVLLVSMWLVAACSGSDSGAVSTAAVDTVPGVPGLQSVPESSDSLPAVESEAPVSNAVNEVNDVIEVADDSANVDSLEMDEPVLDDTTNEVNDSIAIDAPAIETSSDNDTGAITITTMEEIPVEEVVQEEVVQEEVVQETTPTIPAASGQSPGFGSIPGGSLPFVETSVPRQDERYNELAPELQAVFTPDCLFTGNSPVICYRAEDRLLSASLFDGAPFWSFNLPGDNTTNRIEGLEQTGFNSFAIIANVTLDPAEPRQEVSYFDLRGEFQNTFPLFENLRELDGESGSSQVAVNIQGEPLLSLGVFNNFSFGIDSTRLVVAGNYYQLIDGGDPAQLNDWRHTGVIINVIDTVNAERLSVQLIPDAVISNPAEERLDSSGNEVRLVLADQIFAVDMLGLDNLPPNFNSSEPLNAANIHQHIPSTLLTLSENYSDIRDRIISVASEPSLLPGESNCEFPTDGPLGQAMQCTATTDILRTACSISGEYTDQVTSERNFAPGTGEWVIWTRELEFNNCIEDNVANTDAFRPIYNGSIATRRHDGAVRRGNLNEEVTTFVGVTTAFTPISPGQDTRFEESISGIYRQADSFSDFGGPMREIEINLDSYELKSFLIPIRGQFNVNELPVSSSRSVSNHQFTSTEMISDTAPSLTLNGSLDQVFNNGVSLSYELSLSQAPWLTNGIEGTMSVTQSTGANLQLSSIDFPSENDPTAVFEVVFQSASGETASYQLPTEGLHIPWGSTPALQQ